MVKNVLRHRLFREMWFMKNDVEFKAAETLFWGNRTSTWWVDTVYTVCVYVDGLFDMFAWSFYCISSSEFRLSAFNYPPLAVFLYCICKWSLSPWESASQSLSGCFSLKEPRLILNSPRAPESHFRPGCCLKAHNLQLGSLSGGKLFALRTPAAVGLRAGGCCR